LAKEGGWWTADQYTFRMLQDGVISEIVESEQAKPKAEPKGKK
jgi:hypothetical protein